MIRRFTDDQFEAYIRDGSLRASAEATCRSAWSATGPSRKTRSDAYHGSARIASQLAGRTREAESLSEYKSYKLLETGKDAHWYAAQPKEQVLRDWVTVKEDGTVKVDPVWATLDTFVLWKEGLPGWLDIKSRAEFERITDEHPGFYTTGEDGQVRCPTGEDYAAARGLSYRVQVIEDLKPIEVSNASYSLSFLGNDVPDAIIDALRAFLARRGRVLLSDLTRAGFLIDHIIPAAYNGAVYVDFATDALHEADLVYVYFSKVVAEQFPKTAVVAVGGRRPGPVNLAPGEEVLRGTSRLVVTEVAAANVRFVHADGSGDSVEVNRLQVDSEVRSGFMTGLGPIDAEAKADLVAITRALDGASPEALDRAEERFAALQAYWAGERCAFPEVGGGVPDARGRPQVADALPRVRGNGFWSGRPPRSAPGGPARQPPPGVNADADRRGRHQLLLRPGPDPQGGGAAQGHRGPCAAA